MPSVRRVLEGHLRNALIIELTGAYWLVSVMRNGILKLRDCGRNVPSYQSRREHGLGMRRYAPIRHDANATYEV